MYEKPEYRAFTRHDLFTWAPDGERQAMAWNRLRSVCIELHVKVPTMRDVKEMDQDLARDFLAFQEQWNKDRVMFDEEFSAVVICGAENGDDVVFVQFDSGYRF
ncbi:hypothetical protein [Rhodanobacter sp. MP1X3]|uniref:hypothetical protein n=1 Tax=Rhodanobacter sp. MP1X3 TaxID=2723086 RepID=UPI001607873B|nr:hypothetical protein [Rhodanobacter sp. MP1X3]MBB6243717.1 hypothetical protein [Rhodanobacter sp. MP1X3]